MVRGVACDVCHGAGKVPETPCGVCGGSGRTRGRADAGDRGPGRDRGRPAAAGLRRRPRRRAGRAGRRPLRRGRGRRGRALPARRHRPDQRRLDPRHRGDARHRRSPSRRSTASRRSRSRPGTQPGHEEALRGAGLPRLGGRRRGNQRVIFDVVVPTNLSEEQRELAERLDESLEADNLEPAARRGHLQPRPPRLRLIRLAGPLRARPTRPSWSSPS